MVNFAAYDSNPAITAFHRGQNQRQSRRERSFDLSERQRAADEARGLDTAKRGALAGYVRQGLGLPGSAPDTARTGPSMPAAPLENVRADPLPETPTPVSDLRPPERQGATTPHSFARPTSSGRRDNLDDILARRLIDVPGGGEPGIVAARAAREQETADERTQLKALLTGDTLTWQHFDRRTGLSSRMPPELLQNARALGLWARGGLAGEKVYGDNPQQLAAYQQAFVESGGSVEAAIAVAGTPRGSNISIEQAIINGKRALLAVDKFAAEARPVTMGGQLVEPAPKDVAPLYGYLGTGTAGDETGGLFYNRRTGRVEVAPDVTVTDPYRRGSGPTLAQQANNTEIDRARERLRTAARDLPPGVSPRGELARRAEPKTPTGRPNADYDPSLKSLLGRAQQRKVGDDDEFGQFDTWLDTPAPQSAAPSTANPRVEGPAATSGPGPIERGLNAMFGRDRRGNETLRAATPPSGQTAVADHEPGGVANPLSKPSSEAMMQKDHAYIVERGGRRVIAIWRDDERGRGFEVVGE